MGTHQGKCVHGTGISKCNYERVERITVNRNTQSQCGGSTGCAGRKSELSLESQQDFVNCVSKDFRLDPESSIKLQRVFNMAVP